MKHFLVGLSLILGVVFITPAPVAHAWSWSSIIAKLTGKSDHAKKRGHHKWRYAKSSTRSSVPELDPSAAGSSLVLLLGGVAYVMSRRRREDELA